MHGRRRALAAKVWLCTISQRFEVSVSPLALVHQHTEPRPCAQSARNASCSMKLGHIRRTNVRRTPQAAVTHKQREQAWSCHSMMPLVDVAASTTLPPCTGSDP